ncbi:type III secretion low calcium response chaperone LcrH/SycD [Tepidimonas thermarum]|uniref:Type III secretion low calcium response chaperone LcrH/SycD n=1 Tax=Tepidimonas thermarum TaxID=335431 RepID=A0A554WYU3_9BURK|nr:tetratricopeptide repeat protein [Tepidimonas thermarum]TSE28747.1 type III secretion low calcium response chaperone LcrH/SycD [Tepidimonas thermarum]
MLIGIKKLAPVLAMAVGLAALYAIGYTHGLIFDDAWIARDADKLAGPITLEPSFRSLWMASYQAVYHIAGPELYWQRAFNVLLHIVNAILILLLTEKLVYRALDHEDSASQRENSGEALQELRSLARVAVPVAVMIWAVNPVAVYAVQYLTQRSTLMATAFTVAMLLMFIAALNARTLLRRLLWVGGAALAYLMALLSKEHAAPAVALLLPIYVYWHRPHARQLWQGAVVLVGVAVVTAVITVHRKGWTIGVPTEDVVRPFLRQLDALRPGASEQVYVLSVVNQTWLFFRYGLLWVFPWVGWLSVDLRPPFPLEWFAFPQVLGAGAFLLAVAASSIAILRQPGRIALVGLVFLIPSIMFSAELAFVRLQEPFVLYRSYLWSIVLPALWVVILISVLRAHKWILGVGGLLVVGFGLMAVDRIQSLRDDPTAWRDALSKIDPSGPQNALGRWRAPHNLARWELTAGRFDSAFNYAKLADRLGAPNGMAKQKMGSALVSLRRPKEALPLLLAAQSEGYEGVEIWVSIGSAFDQMGRADDAFLAYDRALTGGLHERYRPATLLAAGYLANRVGQYQRAEYYFGELLKVNPELSAATAGLAIALAGQGRPAQALTMLSEAIGRRASADLYHARANVNMRAGDLKKAEQDILEALARDPNNPVYISVLREIRMGR